LALKKRLTAWKCAVLGRAIRSQVWTDISHSWPSRAMGGPGYSPAPNVTLRGFHPTEYLMLTKQIMGITRADRVGPSFRRAFCSSWDHYRVADRSAVPKPPFRLGKVQAFPPASFFFALVLNGRRMLINAIVETSPACLKPCPEDEPASPAPKKGNACFPLPIFEKRGHPAGRRGGTR